jgi:hypothetical protein
VGARRTWPGPSTALSSPVSLRPARRRLAACCSKKTITVLHLGPCESARVPGCPGCAPARCDWCAWPSEALARAWSCDVSNPGLCESRIVGAKKQAVATHSRVRVSHPFAQLLARSERPRPFTRRTSSTTQPWMAARAGQSLDTSSRPICPRRASGQGRAIAIRAFCGESLIANSRQPLCS